MSDKLKDGGAAYPAQYYEDANETVHVNWPGMTLRDWFAGQALAGLASKPASGAACLAEEAYWLADAMLKAREAKS